MTLKRCKCGGAATIHTETDGKVYQVRAVCESCGRRGRVMYDKKKPGPGSASIYWAGMSWNCGLYEKEKEVLA